MPAGVRALSAMGVHLPANAGRPFHGICYVDGPTRAAGHFAQPGLAVRRPVLVAAMLERARAMGATVQFGCSWESWQQVHGRGTQLLVGADGLHSKIRRAANLECAWPGRRRFGVRRHLAHAPWTHLVEVHWTDQAEAYVTPVGPNEIGVAILWDGAPAPFDTLLARFAGLSHLSHARATSRDRGAGPLRQGVRCRYGDNVALVGDAAGYLDALTGEGLTLGFAAARALVDVVARSAPLAEYERAYQKLSRSYYAVTAATLWLGAQPRLRRGIIRLLARAPGLFDFALYLSHGNWHTPLLRHYRLRLREPSP